MAITTGFFVVDRSAFSLWANRLYALDNEKWPRQAQIEVVEGLERGLPAQQHRAIGHARHQRERVGQAQALTGEILKPGGHSVAVGKSKVRKLGMTNFLYSRYVAGPENVAEDEFIEWAVKELRALGLSFKKILCGKSCLLDTNHAPLETHSLLVANLSFEDAVTLQESGLGPHRSMGCGLFIPQKSF